jgi:PAS domain S-box-containing protein
MLTVYNVDSKGRFLTSEEVSQQIGTLSPCPVYTIDLSRFTDEIVGSRMFSGTIQGQLAGELALAVLNGTPVSDLPILDQPYSQWVFHGEALDRFKIPAERLPRDSIVRYLQISLYSQHKSIVWTVMLVFAVLLVLILALSLTILQRKRIENELRASEQRFRRVVENSPLAMAIHNVRGEIEYINQRITEVTGYTHEDLQNEERWWQCLCPDPAYREQVRTQWTRLQWHLPDQESQPSPHTWKITTRNDETREVEFSYTPIGGGRGIISMRDVTDRIRAEEQRKQYQAQLEQTVHNRTAELTQINRRLQEEILERQQIADELKASRDYLETIINCVPDLLLVKDSQHRYVLVNDAFCRLTGQNRHDLISGRKTAHDIFPEIDAEQIERHESQILKTGQPATFEQPIVSPDKNTAHTISFIKTLYRDFEGTPFLVGLGRDMTQKRQTEQELRHYREHLEDLVAQRTRELLQTNEKLQQEMEERLRVEKHEKQLQERLARSERMESLGLLAGGVAHDLNNILSGIVSYPDLLLMGMSPDDKLHAPLEIIKSAGIRAAAVVSDLITIARNASTSREPLIINELIREYLDSPEFFSLEEKYPKTAFRTELAENLMATACSAVHLKKVLMNLVMNAAEAIGDDADGNVTITTHNQFVDQPIRGYDEVHAGEYAVLQVQDNGPGISPEDINKIFEPFYTKKALGRSGTGLGLAVVWNTMKDHDGYIDVQSDSNGTVFKLFFPITRERPAQHEEEIRLDTLRGDGENILVIDDEMTQRLIAQRLLEELGYQVCTAESGEEGIRVIKDRSFDLVLLDMVMTGLNGRETYERILQVRPHQKAVIASGYSETDEIRKTLALGVKHCVRKPYTMQTLAKTIFAALRD